MGLAYNTYLDSNKIYGCKNCKAHLANHEDIISRVSMPKLWQGRAHVPEYLLALYVPVHRLADVVGHRISAANMAKRICLTV